MDDLQQYWLVLKRRWLPISIVFGAAVVFSAISTAQQKLVYEARGQLLFKKNTTSALTGVGRQLGQLEATIKGNPLQNEAAIIESIPVAQRTIQELDLNINPNTFLQKLSVENIQGTDLLELSYTTANQEKAAAVVNTIMDTYIEADIEANRAETRAARQFIEQQLPIAEQELQQAENAIRQLKEQNRVVDLDTEANSTTNILQDLDQQIASARSTTATETARVNSIREIFQRDPVETTVAGFVGESPTTIQVLGQLQDLQKEIETERLRFSESHPTIVNLRQEEQILRAELAQRVEQSFLGEAGRLVNIRNPNEIVQLRNLGLQQNLIARYARAEAERASSERRISALSEVAETYRRRATLLPRLQQRTQQLERQRDAARSTYNNLLNRLQEIRIAENQQLGNARIAAPALVPEQPLIRRQYTNLARGVILGIVLAAVTAWLLETLDKTVKSPQTARQLFDYPLLGTIPNFQGSHLIVRDNSNAFVSEAFRMLQTNLRFLNVDRQCKVIVISSSVGKEGKSVVASNLAIAVAQLGRQVLLIDGDLRQPTQHLIWELPNNRGLSSVLTGQVEFNEAVTEVLPNLQLLASGETSNTPIALIDSSQMAVLIANSAQNYDFVIVDSPPLTASADAMLLGKMTDGIMLVVRPEVADFNSINTSKDLLEQSHQTVLGIVINGIRTKKQPS